jgi:hypothetical protein
MIHDHDGTAEPKRMIEMTNPIIDSPFPSVLVCGTLGSIVSIASVWIASSLVYAPLVGA